VKSFGNPVDIVWVVNKYLIGPGDAWAISTQNFRSFLMCTTRQKSIQLSARRAVKKFD
jgi:hypothetical protein